MKNIEEKILKAARQKNNCHAVRESGFSCRAKPITGQLFCKSHLEQGYGLFTTAVLVVLEVKS